MLGNDSMSLVGEVTETIAIVPVAIETGLDEGVAWVEMWDTELRQSLQHTGLRRLPFGAEFQCGCAIAGGAGGIDEVLDIKRIRDDEDEQWHIQLAQVGGDSLQQVRYHNDHLR